MLLEPQTTAWDLRWQMFGIPVRVHPMFWLAGLLMGQQSLKQGAEYLLAWVACFFISILIHELGHVVMGMIYGTSGQIVLYAFGGLGRYIVDGVAQNDNGKLFGGVILVAALALAAEASLSILQRVLTSPGLRRAEPSTAAAP